MYNNKDLKIEKLKNIRLTDKQKQEITDLIKENSEVLSFSNEDNQKMIKKIFANNKYQSILLIQNKKILGILSYYKFDFHKSKNKYKTCYENEEKEMQNEEES